MDGEPVGGQEKKLIDAARYWVRGSQNFEDAIADLRALNAPEAVIEELLERQKNEHFEVWEENWPALEMFLRIQTQWRATYGQYYGLDYNVLFRFFEIYDVGNQKDILEAIQVIEFAVVEALNEKLDGG